MAVNIYHRAPPGRCSTQKKKYISNKNVYYITCVRTVFMRLRARKTHENPNNHYVYSMIVRVRSGTRRKRTFKHTARKRPFALGTEKGNRTANPSSSSFAG
jgi:hypothetical protein